MAQPVTDDELQLRKRARRRLVGAIVLVLLVVVFLPMALDNEPKPLSKNVDIQVPALDSAENKFPSTTPPPAAQPAPSASPTAPVIEPAPAAVPPTPRLEEAPVAVPEAVKPVPAPEPERKAEPAKKPEAAKKPEPARKVEAARPPPAKIAKAETARAVAPLEAQGYVVQLGAFSNAANAKQLFQKVRAARVPAYLETVKAVDGEKTRVRAGPFQTEEAAEKARQKMLQSGLVKGELKIVKQGE